MDETYYPKEVLKNFYKTSGQDEEMVMYSVFTDMFRDIILEFIAKIQVHMRQFGNIIVTGGEAFNSYVPFEQRVVTSDIDTKFVPYFKVGDKVIRPKDKEFFGLLQAAKLYLWDFLGKECKNLSEKISKRYKYFQKKLNLKTKLLKPEVIRRYILMPKKKTSPGTTPTPEDVLIDVELFALDLNVAGKPLGGILDIAFMRPGEFGGSVLYSQHKGISYRNPVTGKVTFNKDILIASKEYFVHDVYIMNKLKLRPTKSEKDRMRLYRFAKYVLGVSDITSRSSLQTIYNKAKTFRTPTFMNIKQKEFPITKKLLVEITKINPFKYKKYTSEESSEDRLIRKFIVGSQVKLKNYKATHSNFKFNPVTYKWEHMNIPSYIRNVYRYRPTSNFKNSSIYNNNIRYVNTLYAHVPHRNRWAPKTLYSKSAMIPFVGLKNTKLKLVNK